MCVAGTAINVGPLSLAAGIYSFTYNSGSIDTSIRDISQSNHTFDNFVLLGSTSIILPPLTQGREDSGNIQTVCQKKRAEDLGIQAGQCREKEPELALDAPSAMPTLVQDTKWELECLIHFCFYIILHPSGFQR